MLKNFVLVSMLILFVSTFVSADTYSWTDAQGVVNFTDNPLNIPQKYRKRSVVREQQAAQPTDEPASESKNVQGKSVQAVSNNAAPVPPGDGRAKSGDVTYGGKALREWQSEFKSRESGYRQYEQQLLELEAIARKPVNVTRERMLSLPDEHRELQKKYNEAVKFYNELNEEANKAGLPAEYR